MFSLMQKVLTSQFYLLFHLITVAKRVMVYIWRFLASVVLPYILASRGYKKNSVNLSGALSGFLVTNILSLANYCFLFDLFTFFITSSMATKYKQDAKRKFEENFKEGGQRSWVQVVCNGGVAACLGILYLFQIGSGERPIDFVNDILASWLSIGIMSALAFGNADTWASELGTLIAKSQPYLITTWKKIPTGTNSGVTVAGTVLSTLGGLVVGFTHYIVLVVCADPKLLSLAPPQWPLIFFGALAGLLDSLLDSLVGATIQFSGISENGKIVSDPNTSVQQISGKNILSNHNVNLLVTA